jgi:hypothetical protein
MRNKLMLILRIVLVVTMWLGNVDCKKADPEKAPIRVACIGDSITEGGYPQQYLAPLLGSGYVVGNFGASGMCMLAFW